MNAAEILAQVKTDLQISGTAYDGALSLAIDEASRAIEIEGITLDLTDNADCWLVASYAAFLWRKRRENVGMPRHLRWLLNNRLFSEKGAVANG